MRAGNTALSIRPIPREPYHNDSNWQNNCWICSNIKPIKSIWATAFIYDVAAVKKIHGVPPPRFNLVFLVSALFHHEWSRFHHEWPHFNIVLKCFKPTSFLESPHLVWISFCRRNQHFHKPCLTPHLVFIIVNKCSCSYINYMVYMLYWDTFTVETNQM